MPLKQDRLERSLKIAKNALELFEQKLAEAGITGEFRKKIPRWRELVASCKKIESRLESQAELISRGKKSKDSGDSEDSSDE